MRSSMCGLLTRVATIVGSLTLMAFMLITLTLDPGRPARVLHALVTSDAGHDVAVRVLASQVTHYDPQLSDRQAEALARRVVSDPRLPAALAKAENGGPTATVDAVMASVRRYDPTAAAEVDRHLPHDTSGTPTVSLVPNSASTRLFRARAKIVTAMWAGLAVALAAAIGALLVGPARVRVARRIGWWCIGASVFQVVFWVGVPALLERLDGQWPILAAIAIRASGSAVVGVLVTLLLGGVLLVAMGHLGRLGARNGTLPAREPARPQPVLPYSAPTRLPPPPGAVHRPYRTPADVYRVEPGRDTTPTRSWDA